MTRWPDPVSAGFAATRRFVQASAFPSPGFLPVQRSIDLLPRRTLVALALALWISLPAQADESDPVRCPIGSMVCKKPALDWSLCTRNDLLDFYVPGLPTSGERDLAPTEISAKNTRSDDGSTYVLEGDASIRQLDRLIRAERFSYDSNSTAWRADGNLRYQDRSLLLSASAGEGNTDPGRSTLNDVRYQLLDARGNGRAAVANMPDSEHMQLQEPTFSTCTLDSPAWEFRAAEMTLDQANGRGQARDITFRVGDVPILWLPYASFPLDDRRSSGFLYPEIGYDSSRGFDLAMPYYLNLAPNYDATLTPRLMTQRGLMLGGQFRYLWPHSRGEVNLSWLPDDRESGGSRALFNWQNSSRLSDNWSAAININRASDDRYFEDFGRGLNMSATTLLPSRAYLEGRGAGWSASIGGDEYQITDPDLSNFSKPYRRLPRALFSVEQSFGPFEAGLKSEAVAFSKDDALDGQRIDLYPYIALPLQTAGWFLRPELGYRQTDYHLDRSDNKSPSRGLPIASLDAGLIFERALTIGGDAYSQTLEPRVYYLNVPYRDQSDLPIFDTQEVPFTFGQLFRPNRFVGADRQMDANNLTVAMTSRLIDDRTGEERLSASLGQIRYFGDQRVQLPGQPATDYSDSTYVGELDLRINDRWRVTLSEQWNPNTRHSDLSAIGIQNRFGDQGVLNLSWRYRRDFLEQVDASALIPLSPAWRLVARWNYSLRSDETLEAFAGLEHDSCCIAWRVLGRRWLRNAEGQADNALYFEVEFKGVGSVGQQAGDFLRRAILGYQ